MSRAAHEYGARHAYGTRVDPVKLNAMISQHAKDRLVDMARASGISLARMLEILAENTEVDDDGVPKIYDREEELPFRQKSA